MIRVDIVRGLRAIDDRSRLTHHQYGDGGPEPLANYIAVEIQLRRHTMFNKII